MPNSIDFYKGIFLHVNPVRIIVPWFITNVYRFDGTKFLVSEKGLMGTNGNYVKTTAKYDACPTDTNIQ